MNSPGAMRTESTTVKNNKEGGEMEPGCNTSSFCSPGFGNPAEGEHAFSSALFTFPFLYTQNRFAMSTARVLKY